MTPDRELDPLTIYLSEVGRHPLLTKEQEVALAQRRERGEGAAATLASGVPCDLSRRRELRRHVADGDDATVQFVQSNLRLVVTIARMYRASGAPLLDLIQEGNLGLIHAVGKFDWRRGFKFSTYATWWIRQAVVRGASHNAGTIRLPSHVGILLAQVARTRHEMARDLDRAPTRGELAAELGVSPARLAEVQRFAGDMVSLSQSVNEDREVDIGDLVADLDAVSPFDAAADSLLPAEVSQVLTVLEEQERTVIELRFGLGWGEPRTLDEIGETFALSRETVRQIEARALSKLRHPAGRSRLVGLLRE